MGHTALNPDLKHVDIHEIAQHHSSGELIVGTHGRGRRPIPTMPMSQLS